MKLWTILLAGLLLSPAFGTAALAQRESPTDLVSGNTLFALDLFAQLRQSSDGNLVFSPYSVSQALAMTYAGSQGSTQSQMAEVLAFGIDQHLVPEAFEALNASLTERGTADADESTGQTARSLHIANGLWGEQTYPFAASFNNSLESAYGAGIQPADFIGRPEEVRTQINDWVAEQTEDRIQNIVPEGAVTSLTRLILANAIYFYGGWQHTFQESATAEQEFHLLDGTTVNVLTMHQTEFLSYGQGDGFQTVDLPYAGSGLTFTVILPDSGSYEAFEASLTTDILDEAIASLSGTDISLYLPSFEFDSNASLAGTLQAMGMTDAFDPGIADFSGMTDGEVAEPFAIGDVLHKAFISVDEDGTEAAAATVVMMPTGAMPDQEEPLELRIDRPFVFLIRDAETGTILFLGRVVDPSA